MSETGIDSTKETSYFVDEAGDGVLFGPKGRNRLNDEAASKFFMLGMIECLDESATTRKLEQLRHSLLSNPLYSTIPSVQPEAKKTARAFHAKDDHPEIRAKVFELLVELDFKFFAVIKDMRKVLEYVESRNRMDSDYRYHPNELYDFTVRMLFKQRLHKLDRYRICFARRGKSDRTKALKVELLKTKQRFLSEREINHEGELEICPSYPWLSPCLQVADYCLWALQRCYERGESRFLRAIWHKVSLIIDADDPDGKAYGTYLTRKAAPPDPQKIKNRWV
ncbi:DUF3800 domain-containing protein [Pelagicoccus sp. NFK12]|uniref:DUF3800 domain-containing protein n=1 Tax=Pelagicoccus enzymogenes TaxID=2773457 RepID=A0A927FC87_9BACT|nr:DUF3800 domain-containing protein [Pelagicoccus enzymogenes]MBD5781055.1 DUF3800 domain-containing protein [Pelagicoccus enzymogenes]